MGRLPEIKATLRALEAADLGESERRALSYLPPGATIGREVTPNVLAMFPDTVESIIIQVAAHELHHIGYDSVRRKDAATAALTNGPWNLQLAARLLDDLPGQGSATYYCDPPMDVLLSWLSRALDPALVEQMRPGLKLME